MIALLRLWGDLALADPVFLGLLALLPALWFWRRRRRAALPWASLLGRSALPRTPRAALAGAPLLLELLGLGLLVLALARPQRILERIDATSRGVDIVLVLDVSGSMTSPDLDPEEQKSRLDMVKQVADRFVAGRRGDRVGVVTFARFPRVLCPPTLDLEAVRAFLSGVEPVRVQEENATAVGSGLALAVARLHQGGAKSRVVVLLTDGEENVREIEPLDAARAAAGFQVRVYAIAAGRYEYLRLPFGQLVKRQEELDTRELEEIARLTGGAFFRARDGEALQRIWEEIDRLERTELQDRRWLDARDLAAPIVAAGLLFVLLALLGRGLWPGGVP